MEESRERTRVSKGKRTALAETPGRSTVVDGNPQKWEESNNTGKKEDLTLWWPKTPGQEEEPSPQKRWKGLM